ncbi:hypothetical protein F2P81_007033 [Scophthalmus maximus]|uniref:Membrane protein FAM174B n=2 Tax=Scophthalmus maximus TaxID=52904 RepID=A0A6A4T7J5_SCOMX|nr:hypothetical protein F2P81_007033 [Scophthalmus maximus]
MEARHGRRSPPRKTTTSARALRRRGLTRRHGARKRTKTPEFPLKQRARDHSPRVRVKIQRKWPKSGRGRRVLCVCGSKDNVTIFDDSTPYWLCVCGSKDNVTIFDDSTPYWLCVCGSKDNVTIFDDSTPYWLCVCGSKDNVTIFDDSTPYWLCVCGSKDNVTIFDDSTPYWLCVCGSKDNVTIFDDSTPYWLCVCGSKDNVTIFDDSTPYWLCVCGSKDNVTIFDDSTPYWLCVCGSKDNVTIFDDSTPYWLCVCGSKDNVTIFDDSTPYWLCVTGSKDKAGIFDNSTPYWLCVTGSKDKDLSPTARRFLPVDEAVSTRRRLPRAESRFGRFGPVSGALRGSSSRSSRACVLLASLLWRVCRPLRLRLRTSPSAALPTLLSTSSTMVKYNLALTFLAAALWRVGGEPQTLSSPATHFNATSPSITSGHALANITDAAVGSRMSSLMTHLPALKNIVIFICVLTAVLITCLVIRVVRSGRRIRKTRKYDIITTPAERVEMAPLNEENDDEDDSTLFDIKYR